MREEIDIKKIEALPEDIGFLVELSLSENFNFVSRLVSEFHSRNNCFNLNGEALFQVRKGSHLIAIAGLNIDPYLSNTKIGRIRRFYVHPNYRKEGIGALLVAELEKEAAKSFSTLNLHTDTDGASRFYEKLGYQKIFGNKTVSHQKLLMRPTKACPVVIRKREKLEILVFSHPLAGFQLVKGTIECGEAPADAAVRELLEEAGIRATASSDLGLWLSGYQGQIWSLHVCEVATELAESWIHYTNDDGGHDFRFFWHMLGDTLTDDWHPLFKDALSEINRRLAESF